MYSVDKFSSGIITYTYYMYKAASMARLQARRNGLPFQKTVLWPGPVPERRLPILLRRAWFSLNQAFRRRCAKLGVTPDQYTVLRTLLEAGEPGLTQNELASAMCSDANTMASLLRRMEAIQWIERQPHRTDRRAYLVKVLPDGMQQYQKARREATALQREVLRSLPRTVKTQFLVQLELVADACRKTLTAR